MTNTSSPSQPIFYAQDAEEAVIGSVIVSQGRTFEELRELLTTSDFWSLRHRLYWQMFERLAQQSLPMDITLISDEMMRLSAEDLELSGGPAYVVQLVNKTPTSYHARDYAGRVLDMSVRRQALELVDKTRQSLMDVTVNPRAILARADRDLVRLRTLHGATDNPVREMDVVTLNLFNMMEEGERRTRANREYVMGVRTGVTDLDELLDGLRAGITTLAAATGVGKTALTLQIARFAAQYGLLRESVSPANVLFFSGEMTERQLGTRMLASMTGVPARYIERGCYNAAQKALLEQALHDLSKTPLSLVPGARLNTQQIRQLARRLVNSQKLDLLVLDGLLQIEALKIDPHDSQRRQAYVKQQRRDLIEDIMNDLEDIGLSYELPILMTHQLSRAPSGRQNKRPILTDLAEASFVDQKTAVVLFLYREGYYDDQAENPNAAEIIVAKNRHGSTGVVHQIYDAMHTRFVDADKTRWNFGDNR